jgi:hypothetical protein
VDADCVVCTDYYSLAVTTLHSSGADAVGYSYALPRSPDWIERAWDGMHQPPAAGPAQWLYAGNFIIRHDAFDRVGGFDEVLPTGEDPNLGRRLRQAGYSLYSDPSLVSVHLGNPKTLGSFFRQQWWHGLGGLETPVGWRNRPLTMTLLHFLMTATALLGIATGLLQSPLPIAAGVTLSQTAIPLVTVLFRLRQTGRWGNPVPGTILYWLYYWARLVALATVTLGMPKAPQGRT